MSDIRIPADAGFALRDALSESLLDRLRLAVDDAQRYVDNPSPAWLEDTRETFDQAAHILSTLEAITVEPGSES